MIVAVHSAYGHRFMSTDSPEHEACLTCGAMYALVPDEDDPRTGSYMASGGDEPKWCSHDTSRVHGYPGERVCECSFGCPSCRHDCNCLVCDS